ncbi:DUF4148 domain-containing protein [Bordetella genomosp. 13]|uniref:DUF4148 domain-containing protein n=1 Tax=Bordetella genomosp. 13 TaxID=463040 RepID=A0A1W6ZD89_9BORD|nr:DUF4148 domain-containing protein [Bordetella genomosp. 13]ARP95235.1 hypothetical protein CAL15_13085 [Bordetella genomosp. 13]
MKTPVKFLCATLAFAAVATVNAATTSQQPSDSRTYQPRELSRAEVKADLAVWRRAGMDKFWQKSTTPDFYSREYRTAEAEYRRMRNGPEYQQELQRLTQ